MHGNSFGLVHDNSCIGIHANSSGTIACGNSRGHDGRGEMKLLSTSSLSKVWRPAAGESAPLQQPSERLHEEAWAGRVQSSSLRISPGSGNRTAVCSHCFLPPISFLRSCVSWWGSLGLDWVDTKVWCVVFPGCLAWGADLPCSRCSRLVPHSVVGPSAFFVLLFVLVCKKGPTGTRRVKGGVSGPAEDLRPVSEVEAGVNFRRAGGVRGQVAGSIPRRQPGTGTRRVREGAVTPSLHPEVPGIQFVSPGRGLDIRQSMGWTKVCGTAQSGIWVLKGNRRTRMLPANLDHLRVEWRKQGTYETRQCTTFCVQTSVDMEQQSDHSTLVQDHTFVGTAIKSPS